MTARRGWIKAEGKSVRGGGYWTSLLLMCPSGAKYIPRFYQTQSRVNLSRRATLGRADFVCISLTWAWKVFADFLHAQLDKALLI